MPHTLPGRDAMSEQHASAQHASTTERTVWQGTPSQLINLPAYAALLAISIAITVMTLFLRGAQRTGGVVDGPDPAVEGRIFIWFIAGTWLFAVLAGLFQYLKVATTKYHVTSERLRITTGILSTMTEEVELRRVRDTSVVKPFFLRVVGLGDVNIRSDDATARFVTLKAIRDPDGLQSQIRSLVLSLYERYRMREIDILE